MHACRPAPGASNAVLGAQQPGPGQAWRLRAVRAAKRNTWFRHVMATETHTQVQSISDEHGALLGGRAGSRTA